MNPQARKAKTEALLQQEGIRILASLPCTETESETTLRSPEEVGIRIACLFGVVGAAFNPSEPVYRDYPRRHSLWDHLTPAEHAFLSSSVPERQAVINFTWRCEALFLLMWVARLFDVLPMPRELVNGREIVARFPDVEQSPWPFIQRLRLRRKSEILDASDLIYRLHWATRQAGIEGKPAPARLIPGVVDEWHHAINWATRYDDNDWDDVETDT